MTAKIEYVRGGLECPKCGLRVGVNKVLKVETGDGIIRVRYFYCVCGWRGKTAG